MASLNDRIEGVLLGTAAGDALGAPYEFQPPRGPERPIVMGGGGPWGPGEWTDDTAMAVAIAEIAATGTDLRDINAQDALVKRWYDWSLASKDVGIQTRNVLLTANRGGGITAESCRAAARALHDRSSRTAGNGSLMRTAPVALAYLDDEQAMVEAARSVSELTHFDPEAGDAVVLWCSAIRHAVLTGSLDVRVGMHHVAADRRHLWRQRLDAAEAGRPADFPNNGWVVSALQAAWCAIATTPVPQDDPSVGTFRADHLRLALDAAVRAGFDTDTVAAIAGGLLGAAYGASAVPVEWRTLLHGWPGIRAHDLVALAGAIARKGAADRFDGYAGQRFGVLAEHPYDAQVLLGDVGSLRSLPDRVDAVVSMCRLLPTDMRRDIPHAEVRLIDIPTDDENPHLDFVLLEAVKTIEAFRAQGRTVLLHCVGAYSRTPTVGALYGARLRSVSAEEALADVLDVLPDANPNHVFRKALRRLIPSN
jgi:ADP-ribosylglycohydrolase